jgi:5-methylthioadenosine/S-adenosylhomocysteine deaminase
MASDLPWVATPVTSLILRGGMVLNGRGDRFVQSDLLVIDNMIAEVGPGLRFPEGTTVIDAKGCAVLPGLVNAHTHAHNNLARATEDRWTLEDHISHGPAQMAGRTADEQRISALVGAIEMLKTGCTSAFDLFSAVPAPSPEAADAVASAYAEVGIRAVLAPSVSDLVFYRTMPGLVEMLPSKLRRYAQGLIAAPESSLRDLLEGFVRRWHGAASGRIQAAIAPSIPSQCSDEFMSTCVRLAREYGVGLHTHLCESKQQAVSGLGRWGRTVVSHLAQQGALGSDFVGAHAVWLTAEDIQQLGHLGASVAHNPASNLRLGSGLAPIREMIDAGVHVGLGTDGSATSDNLSMFEAMRSAALISRVRFPNRTDSWIGSDAAWRMATSASARVLGLAADIGALNPARKADIVLMRTDSIFTTPLNHALNSLVYCAPDACVETVIVDGRVVVRDGHVTTIDEAAIRSQAQAAADRLAHDNAGLWEAADAISPYLSEFCDRGLAAPFPVDRFAGPIVVTGGDSPMTEKL